MVAEGRRYLEIFAARQARRHLRYFVAREMKVRGQAQGPDGVVDELDLVVVGAKPLAGPEDGEARVEVREEVVREVELGQLGHARVWNCVGVDRRQAREAVAPEQQAL